MTVEVKRALDAVEVAVRDTGHGIPAEELPRLFERFYRGSARQPGTGLGLSIARNLVRLHGGDISVVSEVGRGSEFRLRLPSLATTPIRPLAEVLWCSAVPRETCSAKRLAARSALFAVAARSKASRGITVRRMTRMRMPNDFARAMPQALPCRFA